MAFDLTSDMESFMAVALTADLTQFDFGGSVTTPDGTLVINLRRNDTYAAILFTVSTDYTSYSSGQLTIKHRTTDAELMQVAVTIASSTTITVALTAANTAFALLVSDSEFGPHPFDIEVIKTGVVTTAVSGIAVIAKDRTTA